MGSCLGIATMHISFSQLVGLKQFNASFTESRNENARKNEKITRKVARKQVCNVQLALLVDM